MSLGRYMIYVLTCNHPSNCPENFVGGRDEPGNKVRHAARKVGWLVATAPDEEGIEFCPTHAKGLRR